MPIFIAPSPAGDKLLCDPAVAATANPVMAQLQLDETKSDLSAAKPPASKRKSSASAGAKAKPDVQLKKEYDVQQKQQSRKSEKQQHSPKSEKQQHSPKSRKHQQSKKLLAETDDHVNPNWGRFNGGTWLGALGCGAIIACCPVLVILLQISLSHFDGSILAVGRAVLDLGPVGFAVRYAPRYSATATLGYCAWLLFQMALYMGLPSKICYGQQTPAGRLLPYHVNGIWAWLVSHVAYAAASYYGLIDPALIARNWEGLIVAFNMYGYVLPLFAYVKAHLAPTHNDDRKFSGSMVYDYYMGIEFNPRIGKWFDFKLFHNGRPGIVMWTLINLSFAAYQHQLHGFVTNSMIVVNILHAFYVVDFFVNEDWYLRTIDICHDHYGFYLAWGSMVWLPATYTLQAQYLARNPYSLSDLSAVAILLTGLSGYVLFRAVNHQKDLARRTKGECNIWGRKAEIITARYQTADGLDHETILLCSGWWGVVRHANYLGDLVLSYSVCAASGLATVGGANGISSIWENGGLVLLPWTYAIFMTILLIQRCIRDEERCSGKYGATWAVYCEKVKWRLIPGLF